MESKANNEVGFTEGETRELVRLVLKRWANLPEAARAWGRFFECEVSVQEFQTLLSPRGGETSPTGGSSISAEIRRQFIKAARDVFCDDDLEIDDCAEDNPDTYVSASHDTLEEMQSHGGGCWVRSWIWVAESDLEKEEMENDLQV